MFALCTQGLFKHCKRGCIKSWLWENNPFTGDSNLCHGPPTPGPTHPGPTHHTWAHPHLGLPTLGPPTPGPTHPGCGGLPTRGPPTHPGPTHPPRAHPHLGPFPPGPTYPRPTHTWVHAPPPTHPTHPYIVMTFCEFGEACPVEVFTVLH